MAEERKTRAKAERPKTPRKRATAEAASPGPTDTQTEAQGAAEVAEQRGQGPTHEEIARRAYELWCEGHEDPVANWLRAEAELSGGR